MKPNHTSKDAPCVLGTEEKYRTPCEMTEPLSAASLQSSAGLFVSGLSFVLLRTYMYFNLLLIITAADKKITTKKYTFFTLSFHVYSVKIIGMWSDR